MVFGGSNDALVESVNEVFHKFLHARKITLHKPLHNNVRSKRCGGH